MNRLELCFFDNNVKTERIFSLWENGRFEFTATDFFVYKNFVNLAKIQNF